MNINLAKRLIGELARQNVTEYVVCPGGRNSPLVKILAANPKLKVRYYFEERSAAFFAMGRARQKNAPVAVVTTSGTAVAELLPAMIEATYSGIPLIAVSADRPASYRGTGAPQSMNQVNLFGEHAKGFYNWSVTQQDRLQIYADQPVHINIEFDEPLIDSENFLISNLADQLTAPAPFFTARDYAQWDESHARSCQTPFVIVGPLPTSEVEGVRKFLSDTGAKYYAEAASGLQHDVGRLTAIPSGLTEHFDAVIRIGGVPTHRLWRDLEARYLEMPVLNFSHLPFSGLSRATPVFPLSALNSYASQDKNVAGTFLQSPKIEELDANPDGELAWIKKISEVIPENSVVFLGNSLCIREWDCVAVAKPQKIVVNRGMNGIDGLIASFFGAAEIEKENWLVLGDLSALYDLPSLHFRSQFEDFRLRIVIINNGGGKIFAPMFKDKIFENPHNLNFSGVANMFGWAHIETTSINFAKALPKHCILEVKPSEIQTTNGGSN